MTTSFTIPAASLRRLKAQQRLEKRLAKYGIKPKPSHPTTIEQRRAEDAMRDRLAVERPKATRYYERKDDSPQVDAIGRLVEPRMCLVSEATWSAGLVLDVASHRARIVVPGVGIAYVHLNDAILIDEEHVTSSSDELREHVAKIRFLYG